MNKIFLLLCTVFCLLLGSAWFNYALADSTSVPTSVPSGGLPGSTVAPSTMVAGYTSAVTNEISCPAGPTGNQTPTPPTPCVPPQVATDVQSGPYPTTTYQVSTSCTGGWGCSCSTLEEADLECEACWACVKTCGVFGCSCSLQSCNGWTPVYSWQSATPSSTNAAAVLSITCSTPGWVLQGSAPPTPTISPASSDPTHCPGMP